MFSAIQLERAYNFFSFDKPPAAYQRNVVTCVRQLNACVALHQMRFAIFAVESIALAHDWCFWDIRYHLLASVFLDTFEELSALFSMQYLFREAPQRTLYHQHHLAAMFSQFNDCYAKSNNITVTYKPIERPLHYHKNYFPEWRVPRKLNSLARLTHDIQYSFIENHGSSLQANVTPCSFATLKHKNDWKRNLRCWGDDRRIDAWLVFSAWAHKQIWELYFDEGYSVDLPDCFSFRLLWNGDSYLRFESRGTRLFYPLARPNNDNT